ncbi:NB-ARC domain-containing protein [Streptomyces smyrnaeus]|uniref:NB-ARC domain-containing protein n=1 Tax=Streptomyces smyrnaeus TaxID=1387713 RepID=UPI0036A10985
MKADGRRNVEYMEGTLPPLAGGAAPNDFYVLNQGPTPAWQPGGEQAWGGASGSAVFCNEHLVGVVVHDDDAYENRRLHACRAHTFITDPGFVERLERYGAGPPHLANVTAQTVAETDTVPQVPPMETVPYLDLGLPEATPNFTGREAELDAVLRALAPHPHEEGPQATVVAIAGLPGVGKSELALQAARLAEEQRWFPGGSLFVDLRVYQEGDEEAATGAALYDLLLALGVRGERIPRRTSQRGTLYRKVLAERAEQGQRFLVVVDNASGPEQVRPLLPSTGGVITSRRMLTGLDGVRPLKLEVLSPHDAVFLVEKVVGAGDERMARDRAQACELARLCGHLPLALRICGALLAEDSALSLGELLAKLIDERERLTEFTHDDLAVRAAFDLSYDRLAEREARVFRLLSVRLGSDFSTETAAVMADESTAAVGRALTSLCRASLVDRGTAEGRWKLHDLISVYVADLARDREPPDDVGAARERLLHHYAAVAEDASQQLWSHARAGKSRFRRPVQALAWIDAEATALVAAVSSCEDARLLDLMLRLPRCLDEYLMLRRRFGDLLAIADTAVRAAREVGDREWLAAALDRQGRALAVQGRLEEAVDPLREAASTYHSLGQDIGEGVALSHLARVMARGRMFDNATAAFRRAIRIQRHLGDLTSEVASLLELGETLRDRAVLHPVPELVLLQEDKLREAAEYAARAVFLSRRAGDPYGEGKALRLLGRARAHLHAVSTVVHPGAAADFIRQHHGGLDGDPRTAAMVRDLEMKQREIRPQGRPRDNRTALRSAVRHLEKSVDVFRQYGDWHSEVLALIDLAFAHGVAREHEQEAGALDRAQGIAEENGDPRAAAFVLRGRGETAERAEQYDEAASLFEQACRLFQETDDPYEEAPTRNRLIHALLTAGRLTEAERHLGAAMALSTHTTVGATNPAEQASVDAFLDALIRGSAQARRGPHI